MNIYPRIYYSFDIIIIIINYHCIGQ